MVHGALQDFGVVGHHHEGPGALLEELAQPPALGIVQVVARLVQQEQVGRVQKGAPQLEPHLLAPREGSARALAVLHRKARPMRQRSSSIQVYPPVEPV
jgi:hypothetical protein